MRVLAGRDGILPCLSSAWQPAPMGLQTLALRPWCETQSAFFGAAVAQLHLESMPCGPTTVSRLTSANDGSRTW